MPHIFRGLGQAPSAVLRSRGARFQLSINSDYNQQSLSVENVARNPPIRAGRRTPPTATDPNAEGYGDRSLSFVRPVDETFRCDICHNVMVDPTSTVCGHTFCKACIEASLSNASTCPTCEGQARPIVPINALKQLIGSLEVRCPNPPRDGTECPVLTLDDLDHHLSDCSCR